MVTFFALLMIACFWFMLGVVCSYGLLMEVERRIGFTQGVECAWQKGQIAAGVEADKGMGECNFLLERSKFMPLWGPIAMIKVSKIREAMRLTASLERHYADTNKMQS